MIEGTLQLRRTSFCARQTNVEEIIEGRRKHEKKHTQTIKNSNRGRKKRKDYNKTITFTLEERLMLKFDTKRTRILQPNKKVRLKYRTIKRFKK